LLLTAYNSYATVFAVLLTVCSGEQIHSNVIFNETRIKQ